MKAAVTGGAGFIGSNLADQLLGDGYDVSVVDDLSTGYTENVPTGARLFEAGVTDPGVLKEAFDGCDVVFHLAAARAVARSVEAPIECDTANTHGTLNVLVAARDANVGRVVYASSSSVYGGAEIFPTPESAPLVPRSPYAVTKLAGEHYCRVFTELYGLETVALRYFNVYGPRQRPDSAYAAVIPLFIDALRAGHAPNVHGDGRQSRGFTYVSDVVAANVLAARAPAAVCSGRVYNTAVEDANDLLDLIAVLQELLGTSIEPVHGPERAGDVRHSRADCTAARIDLGFAPAVSFRDGLEQTLAWFAGNPTAAGTR